MIKRKKTDDIGACVRTVSVTNPSVDKISLLSQMMATQKSMMEQNQLLMERMMSQIEEL